MDSSPSSPTRPLSSAASPMVEEPTSTAKDSDSERRSSSSTAVCALLPPPMATRSKVSRSSAARLLRLKQRSIHWRALNSIRESQVSSRLSKIEGRDREDENNTHGVFHDQDCALGGSCTDSQNDRTPSVTWTFVFHIWGSSHTGF